MNTPFLKAVLAIAVKDLRAELRSRELVTSMLLFAVLSVFIFNFALELDRFARRESIAGVLWVTIVFASILGLNRSMALEREQGGLNALLLAPIARPAIFCGKLAANYIFALLIGLALLPLITWLYNIPLLEPWLLLMLALGTLGFSTSGTLLATMTAQARARDTLLPIIMLPTTLPILIAAVRGSVAILNDAPFADWSVWPQVLLVLDLIYMIVSFLLFEYVVEE